MFLSDHWQSYELIDAEGGERLERWDRYILIRPDPQIIWHGERKNPLWNEAHGVYRRQGGGGSWVVSRMPESWCVSYPSAAGELTFRLRPMGGNGIDLTFPIISRLSGTCKRKSGIFHAGGRSFAVISLSYTKSGEEIAGFCCFFRRIMLLCMKLCLPSGRSDRVFRLVQADPGESSYDGLSDRRPQNHTFLC